MKYAWIFLFRSVWPVTLICDVISASISDYFERLRRRVQARHNGPSARHGNEELLTHIRAIHAEVKGEYWPRGLQVYHPLRGQGASPSCPPHLER